MSEKLVIEANDVYKALSTVSRKVAEFENRIETISQENAKLRELAYVSLNFCANGYCEKEYGCPMNNAGSDFGCGFAKACRELGIEESE